jgi:hypothetical protein
MRNIIIGLIAGTIVGFVTKSLLATIIVGIALMIVCFIGSRLLNPQKYIFNNMVFEARKTTVKVLEKVNQQCYDNKILKKSYTEIVGIDLQRLPKNLQDEIDKYLTCIEGLCYIIGLNHSKFPPDSMVMRCIQFITLLDKSLYGYGIKPCSLEKKIDLYKATNLYDAYLNDPSVFYTFENKKEEIISNNDIINEFKQAEQITNENIINKSDKIITIKARNKFPPSDLNIIEIYNELMNTKNLTFELIWDKFQNIQCFNDITLYEKIENIRNGGYSANVSHFIDNDGKDCITYFSCLPNKAIDFLLFQLVLEYFSGEFYYHRLVTNSDDIKNHKDKLKQLKPDSNHAFLYGPYPYYYEKENISYIQAFIGDISEEVLFVDICVLQGEKYEIKNTIIINGFTILF